MVELIQDRWMPFKNDILEVGWLKWFGQRHLKLSLQSVQSLEERQVKRLHPTSVASLYLNLEQIYPRHEGVHCVSAEW